LQGSYLLDAAATLDVRQSDPDTTRRLVAAALRADPRQRSALVTAERLYRNEDDTLLRSENDDLVAKYYFSVDDHLTNAALLTRAATSFGQAGQYESAIERFTQAHKASIGYLPAYEGWRLVALKGQLWLEVAAVCELEAGLSDSPAQRAYLFHLAGVALMDKALVVQRAIDCFRSCLVADPLHHDAFVRLRMLLAEEGNHDELAIALEHRLDSESSPIARLHLHRALGELNRNFLSNRDEAIVQYQQVIALAPGDVSAHSALADIAWETGDWTSAAHSLAVMSRLEKAPGVQRSLCYRLGIIYSQHLDDPKVALGWFERALVQSPNDEPSLVAVANIAGATGDWNRAMAAAEKLIRAEADPVPRVSHWHRAAMIFEKGFGDPKRAERAYNMALDGAPGDELALTQLVEFYRRRADMVALRVHLGRVAGVMRARIETNVADEDAYVALTRAMTARRQAGVDGSTAIARFASEMSEILGIANSYLKESDDNPATVSASLLTVEADDVLFPSAAQSELRGLFQQLGERLSKHIGVDVKHHGVTRADKLANDKPGYRLIKQVAASLGFGDVDVYVTEQKPWYFAAEPTSTVSVIVGARVMASDPASIRFAASAALKLAQSQLAVAARLPSSELNMWVVALIRLFQPDFPASQVDLDAVANQMQKLRRLIPSGQLNELRPFAVALDASRYSAIGFSQGLALASYRAGIASAGSLRAALSLLANRAGVPLTDFLADPIARELIRWSLSEDVTIAVR
jgi:tetratricopeptide (TPR) repeat protein